MPPRTATPRKPPPAIDWAVTLPRLTAALASRGALAPKDLVALGVAKPWHTEAIAKLRDAGADVTPKGVARVALRDQLRAVLAGRGTVPVTQLGKVVAGATGAEAKKAAMALVGDGCARLVRRGKADVVASPTLDALDEEELRALARATKAVAAQCENALKSRGASKTLLRDDVREALLGVVTRALEARAPDLRVVVEHAVRDATRPEVGLAFVPDVVRAAAASGAVAGVHAALLDLARAGRIELRPESGLGRLSAADRALCPALADAPLSWARALP